jgi:hypothetical protein
MKLLFRRSPSTSLCHDLERNCLYTTHRQAVKNTRYSKAASYLHALFPNKLTQTKRYNLQFWTEWHSTDILEFGSYEKHIFHAIQRKCKQFNNRKCQKYFLKIHVNFLSFDLNWLDWWARYIYNMLWCNSYILHRRKVGQSRKQCNKVLLYSTVFSLKRCSNEDLKTLNYSHSLMGHEALPWGAWSSHTWSGSW